MARIPTDQLEHIKTQVSLVRLAENQGCKVTKQGKDYAASCPFHEEKTASCIISPKTNLFHCFGCGAAGSVIDWVMKTQGVSFRFACEILQKDVGIITEAKSIKRSTTMKLPSPLAADADHQARLRDVVDYYHETLKQSPEALEYLASRGLNDPELINRFKLGFANRTLAYQLPEKQVKAGKIIRSQLQEAGILRASGHEHFNGSIVVPIFDAENHNLVEMYGRKILGNKLRKGTAQHLYLPGPHAGVWNYRGLMTEDGGQKEIILCEAIIDAMTFWVNGYKNVTASYGTSGFTSDHLAAFKACGAERILIAYDRDEAGNQAAEKLAKTLEQEGFACYRLHFPKGMDANAYTLEVTPATKSLGVVIRSAQWLGQGTPPERPLDVATPLAAKPTETAKEPVEEKAPAQDETEVVLPAHAVPPEPENPIAPEVSGHEVNITYGSRRYRVRGLQKNTSYEVLKVNVLVAVEDTVHVDTFNMYSAKHRQTFARVAAAESGVEVKILLRDLGQLLLQLESLQDKAIQEALLPKEPSAYTMEDSEREQALELLRDPNLANRIINDFAQTGLVGEPTNALMGYLAAVSRKLRTPLAIIVQSTSAAGKSALMDAVLNLVPEEDRVNYSAMTGQSLFYLGETNLKHKILGIAEEEGVRQAAYALKLLQSQGELTIASTGKDESTGDLVTKEYKVEGPVMLFLTTTAIDIDEELLNRCVVLTINESREQTAAIQQRQRQARTLEGLLTSHHSEQLIQQHHNAQRLLRPLSVVNPYAEDLRFTDSRTRTRRDHEKYLTLIDSITLLHQYQREVKTANNNGQKIEYIETTLEDIALANQLAHEILGRSLDELPPPTRNVLQQLHTLVAELMETESLRQNEVRFTRKDVRETAGLSDKQVRVHLERLVELEYVYAHHGKNGQRYVYELAFDGDMETHTSQLIGLIDIEQLKTTPQNTTTTDDLVASTLNLGASSWSASGPVVATSCPPQNALQPRDDEGLENIDDNGSEIALINKKNTDASYRSDCTAEH